MAEFPHYLQADEMDCGATCLRIIAKYYGKSFSIHSLRQASKTSRQGASLQGLSEAAENIGMRTKSVLVPFDKFFQSAPLPCVAHWNQNHFIVVYRVTKKAVYVSDPGHGLLKYPIDEFKKSWISTPPDKGILLLIEPTPKFDMADDEPQAAGHNKFRFLWGYIKPHKRLIIQLFMGLLTGSILQLIFPFLTQSIVDIGVQNRDLNFIYLILFAQLAVFAGRTTVEVLRSFILMHISSRMNISLVSDFFLKLMKLPIAFFDVKLTGDIMQRINDNRRIEQFLTGSSLNTLFSLFNFVIFSAVLAIYSTTIFAVFVSGTIVYFCWIVVFLKRRAAIDYKLFNQSAKNQSNIIEMICGMQEIKLNNAEREKRWKWDVLQVKLFRINLASLKLTTIQNSGSSLINELKNIIITFLAARLVIDGQVTLGMMLSISYIIGQLNAPVLEMVSFVQQWQDARLSIDRLSEIHDSENEEPLDREFTTKIEPHSALQLRNVSFRYDGLNDEMVLRNVSLTIEAKKITAIVGSSGSGKSTLMKLLLRYYHPSEGNIYLGNSNLKDISVTSWRGMFGTVMQDGYIFSDTIANNIAVGSADQVDASRLDQAAEIANIREFVQGLPLAYNTKIGMEGIGLSAGQKQRILIARAVYQNPDYLFFDEATSALDANNERAIMNNLSEFTNGRTVVVIAHRLSTVKNADCIIVIEKGEIIEMGNHTELTQKKGMYYTLVKNQLELGN